MKVKVRFVQKSKLILGGGTGGGRGGGNNSYRIIWRSLVQKCQNMNYEQVEGKNKLSPPPSYKAVISSTSRGSFENFSSFFYFLFASRFFCYSGQPAVVEFSFSSLLPFSQIKVLRTLRLRKKNRRRRF